MCLYRCELNLLPVCSKSCIALVGIPRKKVIFIHLLKKSLKSKNQVLNKDHCRVIEPCSLKTLCFGCLEHAQRKKTRPASRDEQLQLYE